MKPKLILKSLADIPANALSLAASMPGRAVKVTRREIRAARKRSAEFARDIYARASAPFQSITPWQRGGLNE